MRKKKIAARSYPAAFFFIKTLFFITKIIIFQIKIAVFVPNEPFFDGNEKELYLNKIL